MLKLWGDGTYTLYENGIAVYGGDVGQQDRYEVRCEVLAVSLGGSNTLKGAVRLAEKEAEKYYNTYGSSQYMVVKEGDYTVHAVRYEPKEGGCFIVPEVFA
jgi:hypothetical protein